MDCGGRGGGEEAQQGRTEACQQHEMDSRPERAQGRFVPAQLLPLLAFLRAHLHQPDAPRDARLGRPAREDARLKEWLPCAQLDGEGRREQLVREATARLRDYGAGLGEGLRRGGSHGMPELAGWPRPARPPAHLHVAADEEGGAEAEKENGDAREHRPLHQHPEQAEEDGHLDGDEERRDEAGTQALEGHGVDGRQRVQLSGGRVRASIGTPQSCHLLKGQDRHRVTGPRPDPEAGELKKLRAYARHVHRPRDGEDIEGAEPKVVSASHPVHHEIDGHGQRRRARHDADVKKHSHGNGRRTHPGQASP